MCEPDDSDYSFIPGASQEPRRSLPGAPQELDGSEFPRAISRAADFHHIKKSIGIAGDIFWLDSFSGCFNFVG